MPENANSDFWAFPPPSNLTIASEVATIEFNNSLRDHLSTFSSAPPKNGFGSVELYRDDEIDFRSNEYNVPYRTDIDRWCLACMLSSAYNCDNYTDSENTKFIRTPMKYNKFYRQEVLEVPSEDGGFSNTDEVPSAVCLFSTTTEPYNFTVPFPIVSDGPSFGHKQQKFSIGDPEGTPLQPSTTPSEPYYPNTPSSDWGSNNADSPDTNHTGRIVGAVLGSIGALILFFILLRYLGKRKRQQVSANRKPTDLPYSQGRPLGSTGNPATMFVEPCTSPTRRARVFPGTSPAPFVRDHLSAAERGDLADAGGPPPPAYEEIHKGRESDAGK